MPGESLAPEEGTSATEAARCRGRGRGCGRDRGGCAGGGDAQPGPAPPPRSQGEDGPRGGALHAARRAGGGDAVLPARCRSRAARCAPAPRRPGRPASEARPPAPRGARGAVRPGPGGARGGGVEPLGQRRRPGGAVPAHGRAGHGDRPREGGQGPPHAGRHAGPRSRSPPATRPTSLRQRYQTARAPGEGARRRLFHREGGPRGREPPPQAGAGHARGSARRVDRLDEGQRGAQGPAGEVEGSRPRCRARPPTPSEKFRGACDKFFSRRQDDLKRASTSGRPTWRGSRSCRARGGLGHVDGVGRRGDRDPPRPVGVEDGRPRPARQVGRGLAAVPAGLRRVLRALQAS